MNLALVLSLFVGAVTASQEAQVLLSSQLPTGNIAYTLPTNRTFLLNVPAGYVHGEPHPLVLSFHGGRFRQRRRCQQQDMTGAK